MSSVGGGKTARVIGTGMKESEPQRVSTMMAALLICALGSSPVGAQAFDPQTNPNTPYGSPFSSGYGSQSGTGQAQQTQSTSTGPAPVVEQTYGRAEPVQIQDSRSDRSDNDEADYSDPSGGNGNSRRTERRASNFNNSNVGQEMVKRPPPPSEFETYVEERIGRKLPRFGADLIVPAVRDFSTPPVTTVPPGYTLSVGDVISIGLTGSTEGLIAATVDTNGRIFIPRVGAIQVAGVRYGDLKSVLLRGIGQQYRDFQVSVNVSRLRGIRVYVTGFANNPGAYSVNSLSTLVNATLAAGGPSAGGSFRSIRLYRDGALVSDFDLYDLLRGGDKSRDATLQNQDVLFIPPVGPQVAVTGSVNQEAIYEAKPGEALGDIVRYSGGFNALADTSRVIVYRVSNLDTIGGEQIASSQIARTPIEGGDIVQVISVGTLTRPLERQAVLVRVEGEINRPGNYYVAPSTTLAQVMQQAGGTTSRAFLYGTRFERFSVREQQRESFQEAIDQLEVSLQATPVVGDQSIDPATRAAQLAAAQAVLARLRLAQPDGRVVMTIAPTATVFPTDLALENNDRIYIPAKPTTVGVFGAVYRPASFLVEGVVAKKVSAYLAMAGGPLRIGDKGEIFVVRASGAVLSRRNGALGASVLPGDVIFVPVKAQQNSIWARIRDISQLALSFGLTAAVVAAIN